MLLFLLVRFASASTYEETFGMSTSSISTKNECVFNFFEADADGTLVGMQAYVGAPSSGSGSLTFYAWEDPLGASVRTSLGTTASFTSAGWKASSVRSYAVTAGQQYAFGWCSSSDIKSYYKTTGAPTNPSWGTGLGYSFCTSNIGDGPFPGYSSASGFYMTLTLESPDADSDGYDTVHDCDDADAASYDGAPEIWYDGVDEACDGGDDYDQDGDGLASDAYGGTDCVDTDVTAYPGSSYDPWYDGVDSDCAGNSDYDRDGDGVDADTYGGTDCDDLDPAVHPGAPESWYDGVDQDCNGGSDYDADGDGQDAQSAGGTDCDDTDPAAYSGAPEVWYDGLDQGCDGGDDDDADGDGHAAAEQGGDDCDDADPALFEGCEGIDNDGDGADGAGKNGGCAGGSAGGLIPMWGLLAFGRRRRS